MERTLLIVKPDGVKRKLIGEVLNRFERKGFDIVAGKLITITEDLATQHYAEHEGKPFFKDLIKFITSGPSFVFVVEGENVVQIARTMNGKTSPLEALPGTIRGDFAFSKNENVVHGSDSVESAKREIKIFFGEEL